MVLGEKHGTNYLPYTAIQAVVWLLMVKLWLSMV